MTLQKGDTLIQFVEFLMLHHSFTWIHMMIGTYVDSHIDSATIKLIAALEYFCINFHHRCYAVS